VYETGVFVSGKRGRDNPLDINRNVTFMIIGQQIEDITGENLVLVKFDRVRLKRGCHCCFWGR